MNRREAVRSIALGGAGVGMVPAWVSRLGELAERRAAAPFVAQSSSSANVFTVAQHDTVVTLAELIIPRTDTAGATDAGVVFFIATILGDAEPAESAEFLQGLAWIDARSQQQFGADFNAAGQDQQIALLTGIVTPGGAADNAAGEAFFQAIKRLTVTGYYTSEVGMREELGDPGTVYFADDPGCEHPEHKS